MLVGHAWAFAGWKRGKVRYSEDVLETAMLCSEFTGGPNLETWGKEFALRKLYFLNTWEKLFTGEFLQDFFKQKKAIFGFELSAINNQVLNIVKCA